MSYDAPPPPPPPPPSDETPPPPPPMPYGQQYGQSYGAAPVSGTNQMALWAMIIGISSLCCGVPLGLPAIILGVVGGKEIAASGGTQQGQGMAMAGLILGIVSTVISVGWLVWHFSRAMQGAG